MFTLRYSVYTQRIKFLMATEDLVRKEKIETPAPAPSHPSEMEGWDNFPPEIQAALVDEHNAFVKRWEEFKKT